MFSARRAASIRSQFAAAPDRHGGAGEPGARLGYKAERVSGLGDDAYFMSYSGKAEVRTMVGATELAVSFSGALPLDVEAKTMALASRGPG